MITRRIAIPATAIEQIRADLSENAVKIYNLRDIPPAYIHETLLHPRVIEKCTHAYAALSGSTIDNRSYMFIAGARLDGSDTDLDPIVMVASLDTGQPFPSGVVQFHGNFPGRTEHLPTIGSPISLYDLRACIETEVIPFSEAPIRLVNAMHYMADIYKLEIDS